MLKAWHQGYCPIPGQLIPVQWAEFRYRLQISPVYRCLFETAKFSKKKKNCKGQGYPALSVGLLGIFDDF